MARTVFRKKDALVEDSGTDKYDAVVTLCFLDCFSPEEVAGLINRVKNALHEKDCWLWADVAVPPRG